MKQLALLFSSLGVLALIYWLVDPMAVLGALRDAALGPVLLALVLLAAAYGGSAWRLHLLLPAGRRVAIGEAWRLILAASTLNLILPAKSGDLVKSVFMRRHGQVSGPFALSVVTFEKTTDLLALLAWCAGGLAVSFKNEAFYWTMLASVLAGLLIGISLLALPRLADLCVSALQWLAPSRLDPPLETLRESWHAMHGIFWRDWRTGSIVMGMSLAIWFLHLCQIWLMALALGAAPPFATTLALAPLAILAGLLPVTLSGVGTRDAALIALFRPYMDPATGAALGLLTALRYLLPGIAGLPFFRRYVGELTRR